MQKMPRWGEGRAEAICLKKFFLEKCVNEILVWIRFGLPQVLISIHKILLNSLLIKMHKNYKFAKTLYTYYSEHFLNWIACIRIWKWLFIKRTFHKILFKL